ncbi:glycoside hydrolase family 2 [Prevotella cerevisiae]|uniref:Glycoside hydrolase family 2 n=1 Tax=Segatella cerevisiae TaxID=2053716 RepID=A0ABT1BZU3_9BACT|nr:glycosyl hydrolase [Segatella cerevisiae]MCO6026602.1 glycoside hydrolase family 2 [Segatella cerevisiae]
MEKNLGFRLLWIFLLVVECLFAKTNNDDSFRLDAGYFRNIPATQPLAVYWYWMSDNISKDGVVKDLYAMKRAGITRAYIGNIGGQGVPYGKVGFMSPEWWEILHTALKTATKLGIEIGIFNGPGWSQSGGPWVKPSESMRYLASSHITVKGPQTLSVTLPKVGKNAQDVKILAYPEMEKHCTFFPLQKLSEASVVDLRSPTPAVVRSLTIQMTPVPHRTDAELFVKEKGSYRLISKFVIDRSRAAINVGFCPYAPVVISIPEIKGSEFRLVIDKKCAGMIQDVKLSDVPRVERYPEKTLAKMWQTPHPMFYDYLWRKQPESTNGCGVVPIDKVLDITRNMNSDGILSWKVPEGNWNIIRLVMIPTGQTNSPASPEATGLEVDKMSECHVRSHFNAFLGEILRRIPSVDRKTFKVVVEDSYETGGQNWTDSMITNFKKSYGYDPIPYLPVFLGVVVGSEDQSDRFLWDVRRLIADEVAYKYVGGLRKVSHEHGLTTWLENYGHWGFPAEFLQYGGQSDEVAGEFWSEGDLGNIENRAASSCAHIYGKQKVWAESFTCGGPDFTRYPAILKPRGDRFFTEGINSTLLHLYIEQPDERVPGINAPFGNEFNRHNTWFPHLDVFAKYLKRCNYMLQQGQYVADVAYFIGEDVPKMTGICDPPLPRGYSFDYINSEVLLLDATVQNGLLTLKSGMQYCVLVLPHVSTMRPEILRKIRELVRGGLTIVGPAPECSPSLQDYPEADREVRTIAREMWNPLKNFSDSFFRYGKGRIYTGHTTMEKVLRDLDVLPDFSCSPCSDSLLFIHCRLSQGSVYFISNQSGKAQNFTASFRVKGFRPELWNPQTAEIRLLPNYKESSQMTHVPLKLQPFESAFIVFRHLSSHSVGQKEANFPSGTLQLQIRGPWKVSFPVHRGGPTEAITFDSLSDWINNKDERIRYFSGEATYMTSFEMNQLSASETYLDLGRVMVMAKVRLNGHDVGGVWTCPYRVNITKYLKKGRNELEVMVVNDWMNRLIRDKALPEKERITWQTHSELKSDTPLQSSGLLGPVEIRSYRYYMLQK